MTYLLDTGPLVGIFKRNDPWFSWCLEVFQHLSPPFFTCEAVLTETSHFLEPMSPVFELLQEGELVLNFQAKAEARQLRQLMEKYEQMSFADACIVRMAELFPDSVVITLDRQDFSVYRMHQRKPIRFIAPEK